MTERRIATLEEFKSFAREFAATLKGGDVVGLVGDLGAGKTTMVQEIAAALGVTATPKSPTFVLMQIHSTGPVGLAQGVSRLCHVDAYRLDDIAALRKIGFEEYADDPGTVSLVEWVDRVPELKAGPSYREVAIAIEGEHGRIVRAD